MNKDLQIARKTIDTEIQALKKLLSSFKNLSQFSKAVNLILKIKGKVIVTGIGKSNLTGQIISSSLASLGTPSISISGNDLQHGSLGAIQKNYDVLLVLSVSGQSSELQSILTYSNRHNIPVIGVSCKSSSMLIKHSNIKIVLPKVVEAGHSLAPTSSSLNFLSFGHALGIALMKRKKFTNKKFITTHPSGSLATALIKVKEIMATGNKIPIISKNKKMKSAVSEMTKKKLGMIIVKSSKSTYCITDGDLRRFSNNLFKKRIIDVATKNPAWISEDATALSAIDKMTTLKISSLLVHKNKDIKKNKKCVGILTMLQCLSRGIK